MVLAQFDHHIQAALRVFNEGIIEVPSVARQNRANHLLDAWIRFFIEDHILKAAIIPSLHIGAEGIHPPALKALSNRLASQPFHH